MKTVSTPFPMPGVWAVDSEEKAGGPSERAKMDVLEVRGRNSKADSDGQLFYQVNNLHTGGGEAIQREKVNDTQVCTVSFQNDLSSTTGALR